MTILYAASPWLLVSAETNLNISNRNSKFHRFIVFFIPGAFLIPYFVMLIFEGLPIFYLELSIGQRLRQGSINVWSTVSPYLGGVGIASTIICILVGSYYNVVISWVLFYFFHSFRSPLPWAECPRISTYNRELNRTDELIPKECSASSATAYYYHRETLMHAGTIEESAEINWKLAVALAVAWVLAYLCIVKSIQSSGKVCCFIVVLATWWCKLKTSCKFNWFFKFFLETWSNFQIELWEMGVVTPYM